MDRSPVTEIRCYGNGKAIVVYTNDNEIFNKFRDSRKCFHIALYEQEQNGKTVLVGVDLYFSRKDLRWVKEHLVYSKK